MNPLSALRQGIRRVRRAPAIIVGVWLMTVLVSLPLTLALGTSIQHQLGGSLEAERAARGVDYDWMQEFAAQANGVGVTFKPAIIGFGAVLDNISGFADDLSQPLVIVAAASAYLAFWMFVTGG